MKSLLRRLNLIVFVIILFKDAPAQILAWDTNGLIGDEVSFSATTKDPNLASSLLTRGSGIAGSAASDLFNSRFYNGTSSVAGTRSQAITDNEYFQFTVNCNAGYSLSLSTLNINLRRSATGPDNLEWQYSFNGFATPGITIGSSLIFTTIPTINNGVSQAQINLSLIAALQNIPSGTTITFRLYGWGATSSTGVLGIGRLAGNDLALSGTVCALPQQPLPFITSSSFVCQGQNNVEYTVPNDIDVTSYTWSYDGSNATFNSTTNSVNGNFAANATSGTLKVVANNSCGSSTARITTIAVNNVDGGAITADQAICSGSAPAEFTSTTPGTGGGTITYRWEKSISPFSEWTATGGTGATYTSGALTEDTRFRRVAISTLNTVACETSSNEITVTVKTLSNAPSNAITSATNFCASGSTTLNVVGGSLGTGAAWKWYTGGCGTEAAGTLVHTGASFLVTPTVTTTYYVRAEGDCNTTSCASVTVNVNQLPVVIFTPASPGTLQYSDNITPVIIFVSDAEGGLSSSNVSVSSQLNGGSWTTGLPSDLSIAWSGSGSSLSGSLTGKALSNAGTYNIKVVANDGVCNGENTYSLIIESEKVCSYYNGQMSVAATSLNKNSSKATIPLSVGIDEMDGTGDVTTALVEFRLQGYNGGNWFTVPVQSLNSPINSIGNATVVVEVTFNGSYDNLLFEYRISGNYASNSICWDNGNAIISVYVPQNEFITGGGYVTVGTYSRGTMAADGGSRANFGFNVKYNKKGTNLQGNINYIFRRFEISDQRVHAYQVKGNSMTSLNLGNDANGNKTAVFNGMCNITDLTTGSSVDGTGNSIMQVMVTDKEQAVDEYGITIWKSDGQVVHSNNWVSTSTVKVPIAGGNIVVHDGSTTLTSARTTATTEIAVPLKTDVSNEEFAVTLMPNPSPNYFTMLLSGGTKAPVTLRVTDVSGKVIEVRNNVSGLTIQFGNSYSSGVYIAAVMQGNVRKTIKLIKL